VMDKTEEVEKMNKQKLEELQLKYNFDFENEQPLEGGKFKWKKPTSPNSTSPPSPGVTANERKRFNSFDEMSPEEQNEIQEKQLELKAKGKKTSSKLIL
jgi:hypothetical protein